LKAKSRAAAVLSISSSNAELLLHAYDVWGDACAEHLLGDFSFAIWDAPQKRLFAARDHFGMKMFYYARTGNSFIFSNTLDCLRLHPGISDWLNEQAIADFLMFESNQDMGTTTFADILRLAPAHTLVCTPQSISIRRFWKLPEEAPLHFKRPQECIDQFKEIFDSAVSDRMPGKNAALLLSGGLDSPTVAVSARRTADHRDPTLDLKGYTQFHEGLIPHEEKHYAGLVGQALRIPIEYLPLDDSQLFDHYDDPDFRTPEPMHYAMGFRKQNPIRIMSGFSRTGLTGFGGDPALASLLTGHFRRLYKARQFGRMVSDAARFLASDGRLSRLYLRNRMRRLISSSEKTEVPPWLSPDMVRRLNLKDRWNAIEGVTRPNQSARPEGYEATASPYWTINFQSFDAGETGFAIEVCHPFFDLRVLKCLLALPVLPWSSDKEILRCAARGILPDAVRLREKSPLIADPISALLQRPESSWVDRFEPVPELQQYVKRDEIPKVFQMGNAFDALVCLRPLSLNFWLQRRSIIGYKT
jgi:asparagine synthase (glutamine-hydrolysing)